ncbi:MAG: HDOD domain-containing protein [Fibrobacteres bacterium]|nr:HDOD domain-containing protein [Fibrobacterota bacterium]
MATIKDKILERLEGIDDLPPAGPQFLETQRLICDGKHDAGKVASYLEKDLALSAKVLRIANSVVYGGRYGEIGSLPQAIARLGMDEVCRLTMAVKAMAIFEKSSGVVDPMEFWHHSIAVAMVTRNIVAVSKHVNSDPGQTYIAGLMHDIGIFIMDRYFPDVYRKVRESAAAKGELVHIAEKRLLGIEHGEIGAVILEKWRFPEVIVTAVKCHNSPDEATDAALQLTQILHIADFACSAIGAGEPGDAVPQTFSLGAWHDLNIDADSLSKIVSETEEEIAKAKIMMNINK